jgi:metallo-beta-lactamase family protein
MKISFYGAAEEVTGSCHLLTCLDAQNVERRILIDCGMFQGEQLCATKNKKPFAFDSSNIDGVFVTHPHADHTGRLPVLVKSGYTGTIYMTEPCFSLTKLVLEDAHHIMVEDSEKCGSEVLYDLEDLIGVFEQAKPVSYHEAIELAPGVSVMFHDAGHVLGSAYITVEAEGKRVVFSGDIGNDDVPILPPTDPISHADVVVCESTYGHRVHEDPATRSSLLRAAMEETLHENGVLLIPAFSIERTQELLYEMDLILRDLKTSEPIYLDSPMAIKATQLYRDFKGYLRFQSPILEEPDRDFFSFPNLHETLSVDASKQINDAPAPKIIIAGSGMMNGGRIMHHLTRYLPNGNTTILVVGYQAAGTIGRQIFEGAKQVSIYGQKVDVRAKIQGIGAFSAHGDQNKLTRWMKPEDGIMPKKIFLVHGDEDAKIEFAEHLRKELKTEVVIPNEGMTVDV